MTEEWCHPSNAVRTKCVCGKVIPLGRSVNGSPPFVTCRGCRRIHRKAPGGWHGVHNGGQRSGGPEGCPGIGRAK